MTATPTTAPADLKTVVANLRADLAAKIDKVNAKYTKKSTGADKDTKASLSVAKKAEIDALKAATKKKIETAKGKDAKAKAAAKKAAGKPAKEVKAVVPVKPAKAVKASKAPAAPAAPVAAPAAPVAKVVKARAPKAPTLA